MKFNHYLSVLFISASVFANAQYKRSYNHYYRTPKLYQSSVIAQTNETTDLVRAELNASGDLLISSSNIDKNGDLTSVSQFSFSAPSISGGFPIISGVFDSGNERTVMLEFPVTSTMNLYIVKYDKTTGVESGHFLHPDLFRSSFINSIINGNEIVNYVVKSSGGLYRVAFDVTDVTTYTEEVIDAAASGIGNFSNIATGKDSGKLTLFNGKEVASFVTGPKQIYERTAANTYLIHALNSNSSGSVNFVHLDNGNLFVSNNGDLFILNNNFLIVNSRLQEYSTGSLQSEFGLLNNKLQQFYTKNGQPRIYNVTYDLNLNLVDSVVYGSQKLIDLIPTGNGLALLGYIGAENQVNALYNGDENNFTSNPVFIDYFTSTPNPASVQEFHNSQVVDNLHFDFGLGNQFFPSTTELLPGMKYNDSISLVYTMANVYVGYSNTDTLGCNASYYQPNFLPGPYTTSGMYSDLISDYYNRGFFVSREMIENHLDSIHFGSPDYVAPHGIRNWPAHGNTALGQAADLAPFVDVNFNGQYEPYLGDYPSIYGDYCFFSITHDNPNAVKSASVETHAYKYWFDCDTSVTYQNTIFCKTLYFSRVQDFDQFSLGTFGDVDLGNYSDDYGGTHAELGLMYQYNGDLYDENNAGRIGFHDRTPATGMMVLKGSRLASDTVDNPEGIAPNSSVNGYGFADGVVDNEFLGLEHSFVFTGNSASAQADPSSLSEIGNYLNGFWRYGDTLFYGGSGFPSNPGVTSIPSRYSFPGDSDTLFYGTAGINPGFAWSEMEPNGVGSISNPAGDRRFFGSTGKQTLYVGDTIVYDIVYVISNDTAAVTTLDQSFNSLFAKCKVIKEEFNQNGGPCGINFNPIEEDLAVAENQINDVLVYPNPTSKTFKIDGLLTPNSAVSIYDMEGRLLFEQQNINAQSEFSIDGFKGNVFIVSIRDGSNHYIKRIIKN